MSSFLLPHCSEKEVSAGYMHEYMEVKELEKARTRFNNGHTSVLLVSQREHYYRRMIVKGARKIVFFSLPDYPHYFSELVNGTAECSTVTLFTKYDCYAMEGIIGKDRTTE
mmetsp:Transcript_21889/g.56833  ORF Transcript_21889/g.56833 Transcript_21889/m.56833 type:complete len:111 (-) Transcript_21889:48-380(-)